MEKEKKEWKRTGSDGKGGTIMEKAGKVWKGTRQKASQMFQQILFWHLFGFKVAERQDLY